MYCTCPGKCEQNSLDRERSDSDPCVPMAGNTRLSEQCAFRGGFEMFLLGACIALTFLNSFFLAPGIVNSMIHMFELEKGTNVALAVGFCDRSELKKQPDYVQYYKLFRMYHSVSGVANILTMICNVVYVYHLACLCTF
ncbi:hypothetical protein MAR_032024 [Mya arenaria]|uniref:Anoctamin n=1 Tax=Mya arenaria TaxID=6604 RepID=A0ABY7F5K1_MYAAR|nr:hypothetical protein MAR_032024 [Mya arenaria]